MSRDPYGTIGALVIPSALLPKVLQNHHKTICLIRVRGLLFAGCEKACSPMIIMVFSRVEVRDRKLINAMRFQ